MMYPSSEPTPTSNEHFAKHQQPVQNLPAAVYNSYAPGSVTAQGYGCPQIVYACQPVSAKYERLSSCQVLLVSVAQLVLGLACIALNAALIGVIADGHHYEDGDFSVASHGIWGGIFFTITGGIGIGAATSKNKCPVIAYMVLCIISAVLDAAVFSLSIIGICGSYSSDTIGLSIALAVLSGIEGALAIWGSILCCAATGCCCCHTNTQTPYVGQGQPVQILSAGGQPVYVVTSPPQYMLQQPSNGGQYVTTVTVPSYQA